MADLALSKRLDYRPPEVLFNLNYSVSGYIKYMKWFYTLVFK